MKQFALTRFILQTSIIKLKFLLYNAKCYWKAIKDLVQNYKSPNSIPVMKRTHSDTEEFCFSDEEKAYYFISVST